MYYICMTYIAGNIYNSCIAVISVNVSTNLDISHSDTTEERHYQLEEMAVPTRRHQKAAGLVVPENV